MHMFLNNLYLLLVTNYMTASLMTLEAASLTAPLHAPPSLETCPICSG